MEACVSSNKMDLFNMYKKEYLAFRDALKIECNPMWEHLDNLFDRGF